MILDTCKDKTPEILPDGFYLMDGRLQFIFDHKIGPSIFFPKGDKNWVRIYEKSSVILERISLLTHYR